MIVKNQRPIKFNNTCDCIVDETELAKAIIWYSESPVSRNKKIFMSGKYPAVAIYKEKIHVHRLLMMYWKQRRLESYEYVHHKDENKKNSLRGNLEVMGVSEHQSHHTKGRRFSDNHRRLLSEANRRRVGIVLKKRVNIDLNQLREMMVSGESYKSMARYFKCDPSTIKSRIYENPSLLGDTGGDEG